MSKTTTDKKRPAYRIYSVAKEQGKEPIWTELGAAWPHEDGKGLSLQFRASALPGTDIVLREPLPPKTEEAAEG